MTLLHILSVGFAIALIVLSDKEAFAWMRGEKERLDARLMRTLHALTWIALLSLIVTGAMLFYPRWEYLLGEPLFLMKLLLVATLVVNGVLIGRLMPLSLEHAYKDMRREQKLQLFVSGGVSFLCWSGSLALGLILFYF